MKPKTDRNPKGAGCKSRQERGLEPLVTFTVRLEPNVYGWLEFIRSPSNLSQSAKVSELIEQNMKDFEKWKNEKGCT